MGKWEEKAWKDVLSIINGKNQKAVLDVNGEYPIYGSGGIMAYANDYLCNEGTTIVGRKGSINNPMYIETKFWNVDTAFGISSGDNLDSKFLHYFCLGYDFTKHNKSTTLPSLTKRDLLEIKIPLPPLQEQQRIVAKLDGLFAKIDQAIGLLEENMAHTQALMGSVLDGIFDKVFKEHKAVPLLKYVDFIGGSQPPKSSFSYELKEGYVRLIQIRDYKSDRHLVYIKEDSTKKFCNEDDVMIGRYGPPVFQILRGLKGAYNVALMKAIPDQEVILKDYLYYFLMNGRIQNYIISISQRAAGQSGVNKKALEAYEIAIPSLKEQQKIVDTIKSAIPKIDKAQELTNQNLENLKSLKSSLLDLAFKGEL